MTRRKADEMIARAGVATGAQVNAYIGMAIIFTIFKVNRVVDWSWSAVLTPLVVGAIYWLLMAATTAVAAYREERKP